MKMNYKEVMGKLFDFDPSTFYTWKKQNRPIIVLIEKYFSKEDIEEFLNTGKINKFDALENINFLKEKSYDFYIKLKRKLPPETVDMLLDFLSTQNNAKIELLAQYIFSLDDSHFKIQVISEEDRVKLKRDHTHKISWPKPVTIKLLILQNFQELDNFMFDFFCSNIQNIYKIENERIEKYKTKLKLES